MENKIGKCNWKTLKGKWKRARETVKGKEKR